MLGLRSFILMLLSTISARYSSSVPARHIVAYTPRHEQFIPQAEALWSSTLELKQTMLDKGAYDGQEYCRALQDMLNQCPNPKNHIWDYIYTGIQGREAVPAEVEFMRDIYTELMWAFETDNV